MKRRTLDLLTSTAAVALAGLLVVLAVVMTNNADFARDYVGDQLRAQQLRFKPAGELSPAEKAYTEARTGCLLTYAGQVVQSGKQAECWANEYVGGHLKDPQRIVGANGKSYSELGAVQRTLREQIAAAQKSDPAAAAALQTQLDQVTTARRTVFEGEMIRGSLLTSYGFSVFGAKARQVANVAFLAAAVLALLAVAGYVHALLTPTTRSFAEPEHVDPRIGTTQLAGS